MPLPRASRYRRRGASLRPPENVSQIRLIWILFRDPSTTTPASCRVWWPRQSPPRAGQSLSDPNPFNYAPVPASCWETLPQSLDRARLALDNSVREKPLNYLAASCRPGSLGSCCLVLDKYRGRSNASWCWNCFLLPCGLSCFGTRRPNASG